VGKVRIIFEMVEDYIWLQTPYIEEGYIARSPQHILLCPVKGVIWAKVYVASFLNRAMGGRPEYWSAMLIPDIGYNTGVINWVGGSLQLEAFFTAQFMDSTELLATLPKEVLAWEFRAQYDGGKLFYDYYDPATNLTGN
jgi:hypothetical protein